MRLTPAPFTRLVFWTSFVEKYDECLRKTAELRGEMMKGLGYRLKRIHKATPNGFQRRLQRPSWCGARGDILREKSFISYFLSFRTEDLSRHVFIDSFIEDKVQKIEFHEMAPPILPRRVGLRH